MLKMIFLLARRMFMLLLVLLPLGLFMFWHRPFPFPAAILLVLVPVIAFECGSSSGICCPSWGSW